MDWGWFKLAYNCENGIMQKSLTTILEAWVNVQTVSKLYDQQSSSYPQLRYHHRFPFNRYVGFFPLRRPLCSSGRLKQITYSNNMPEISLYLLSWQKVNVLLFFLGFFFSNTQEVNIAFMKCLLMYKKCRELCCETIPWYMFQIIILLTLWEIRSFKNHKRNQNQGSLKKCNYLAAG